jgi:hypothetical protein
VQNTRICFAKTKALKHAGESATSARPAWKQHTATSYIG